MSFLHEVRTQNQLGKINAELKEQNRLLREQLSQMEQSTYPEEYDPQWEWLRENRVQIILPMLEERMIEETKDFAKSAPNARAVKKFVNSLRDQINSEWGPYLGITPISRKFARVIKQSIREKK